MENSVENVENSELSTGISLLWKFHTACGKQAAKLCTKQIRLWESACYVTGPKMGTKPEFHRKSLQIVKTPCQILSHSDTTQKFFVKNTQRSRQVSFFHNRGILDTSNQKGKLPDKLKFVHNNRRSYAG